MPPISERQISNLFDIVGKIQRFSKRMLGPQDFLHANMLVSREMGVGYRPQREAPTGKVHVLVEYRVNNMQI